MAIRAREGFGVAAALLLASIGAGCDRVSHSVDAADAGSADASSSDSGGIVSCTIREGVTIPVGVIYSTGCECCVCDRLEGPVCTIDSSDCLDGGAPFVPSNPNWPVCTSTADCEGRACLFEPGCSQPRGVCYMARWCPSQAGSVCGCDGETLAGPTRPWAHAGDCP